MYNFAAEFCKSNEKMVQAMIPLWGWILFYVLVLAMLIIDLKSFGKK